VARSARPDDKLRDEAIRTCPAALDCVALLAMTRLFPAPFEIRTASRYLRRGALRERRFFPPHR
jgi:hypothetical protein